MVSHADQPDSSAFRSDALACLFTSSTISCKSTPLEFFSFAPVFSRASAAQLYFSVLPSLKPSSRIAGAVDVRGNCVVEILIVLCASAGRAFRNNRGTLDAAWNGLKAVLSEVMYVVIIVEELSRRTAAL